MECREYPISNKEYSIKWYNPREGGELQMGSIETVAANGIVEIGLPPADKKKDWIVLIQVKKGDL